MTKDSPNNEIKEISMSKKDEESIAKPKKKDVLSFLDEEEEAPAKKDPM